MAVYHQDVEHLFTEGSICSQLALAQPGEDVSGGYAAILRTFTCSPQAVRAATAFPRAAHQLGLFRLRAVFLVRGGRTLVLVSPASPLGLPITGAALGVGYHDPG